VAADASTLERDGLASQGMGAAAIFRGKGLS
jgi:hypothetical protein